MKATVLGLALILAASVTRAEIYEIASGNGDISFSVKHLMLSNAKGKFNKYQGTVELDANNNLVAAEVTIDASSIDTNNEKRDKHLMNEDFFNITKFANITFKSTAVKKTGDGAYDLTGNLNVLGKDHEITIPVSISGPVEAFGSQRIGFTCQTDLDRFDIGINYGKPATIGKKVKVDIEVQGVQQKK